MSESNSDAAQVGTAGVLMLFGTATSMLGGLALRLVIARNVTPEVFGSVVLFLSMLNVVSIISILGLNRGVVKYVSGADSRDERNGFITLSLVVPVIIGSICGLVLALGAEPIADSLLDSNVILPFVIGATIPFYAATKILASILRGTMNTRLYIFYYRIVVPSLKVVAAGLALFVTTTALGISTALGLGFLVMVLIGLAILWRLNWSPHLPSDRREIRSLFEYSIPLLFAASIYQLLTHFDKFAIGYYLDPSAVGVYEVALAIGMLLTVFNKSFGFLLFPKVSKLESENDLQEVNAIYQQTTKLIVLFTTPAFLIVLHRPNILIALFGEAYEISRIAPVLSIIALGILTHAIVGPNSEALLGLDRPKAVLTYNVVGVVINVLLNIVLIPILELRGAAIALLAGYGSMNFLKAADLYINHDIFVFDIRSITACGGVVIVTRPFVSRLPQTSSFVSELIVVSAFGGVVLVVCLTVLYLLGGISQEDREIAAQFVPRLD
jgi:O-antigen/teichoic acid export membrane protein